MQQTDRSRMAGEFFNRLTKLYLKLERFSEAINNIDNEIDMYTDVHVSFSSELNLFHETDCRPLFIWV